MIVGGEDGELVIDVSIAGVTTMPATCCSTEILTSTPLMPLWAWVSVTAVPTSVSTTGSCSAIRLNSNRMAAALVAALSPDRTPTTNERPAILKIWLPSAVAVPTGVNVCTFATPPAGASMKVTTSLGPRRNRRVHSIA